jgi:hypothetical protein
MEWLSGWKTWQYPADAARPKNLIAATNADLVVFAHGHNDYTSQAQSGDMQQLRDKAIGFIENMRMLAPSAMVVLSSRNLLLGVPQDEASEYRSDMYMRLPVLR